METLFCDGATKGNGNFGGQRSYVAVVDSKENVLADIPIGDKTNIEAEALALITAYNLVVEKNLGKIQIKTDSKFWVDAISKNWKLKVPRLFPLRDELKKYKILTKISPTWVPRELNLAGFYLEKKYENQGGYKPTSYLSKEEQQKLTIEKLMNDNEKLSKENVALTLKFQKLQNTYKKSLAQTRLF